MTRRSEGDMPLVCAIAWGLVEPTRLYQAQACDPHKVEPTQRLRQLRAELRQHGFYLRLTDHPGRTWLLWRLRPKQEFQTGTMAVVLRAALDHLGYAEPSSLEVSDA
jgi:hypothetical protein